MITLVPKSPHVLDNKGIKKLSDMAIYSSVYGDYTLWPGRTSTSQSLKHCTSERIAQLPWKHTK